MSCHPTGHGNLSQVTSHKSRRTDCCSQVPRKDQMPYWSRDRRSPARWRRLHVSRSWKIGHRPQSTYRTSGDSQDIIQVMHLAGAGDILLSRCLMVAGQLSQFPAVIPRLRPQSHAFRRQCRKILNAESSWKYSTFIRE